MRNFLQDMLLIFKSRKNMMYKRNRFLWSHTNILLQMISDPSSFCINFIEERKDCILVSGYALKFCSRFSTSSH